MDEATRIDDKLRKDAKPLKPGGLYKSGMNKKVMGDRAVMARRNMRNAMDRTAADKRRFGSMSPEKERAERIEKHKAARGVKKEEVNPTVQSALDSLNSIVKKNFNLGEEGYDIARDQGRIRPSKDKKDGTSYPPSEEMKKTQKVNTGPSALDRVKKKYGKAVMNLGKK